MFSNSNLKKSAIDEVQDLDVKIKVQGQTNKGHKSKINFISTDKYQPKRDRNFEIGNYEIKGGLCKYD